MTISEAFYSVLNHIFIDMIPQLLTSEPFIYFTVILLLAYIIICAKRLMS